MNRLVIIGNGFDLAHGLPTSYRDFIDDFWRNFKDNYKSVEYQDIVITHDHYNGYLSNETIKNFKDFKTNLQEYCVDNRHDFNEKMVIASNNFNVIFQFSNDFFKEINNKNSENWVDIENEYYRLLKKIVNEPLVGNYQSERDLEDLIIRKENKVKKLNCEFNQVKNLLEKYLVEKVEKINNYQNRLVYKIFDISEKRTGKLLKEYLEEFPKEDEEELVIENNLLYNDYNDKIIQRIVNGEIYHQTIFLNFNYTSTVKKYIDNLDYRVFKEIQIHGEVENINNLINFGFGDEMDDNYKQIENLNNNEFLKYFKSFQYLQNNNYKKLLDFIETSKFQVYLMGHSCGLSDRTLLNTIFEHNNCRSIKVFYHLKEDGTDNYTDIIHNISRHFNKKKLMREKIVNKELCSSLPHV